MKKKLTLCKNLNIYIFNYSFRFWIYMFSMENFDFRVYISKFINHEFDRYKSNKLDCWYFSYRSVVEKGSIIR